MRREWMWMIAGAVVAFVSVLVAVTASAQERRAPPPVLQDSLAGRDNFRAYCASCHGASGKGDGPVTAELLTPPADLTALSRRNDGQFPRARVTGYVEGTGRELPAHGPTAMPVWGPIFRAFDPSDARVRQRIENLVTYIESIQAPTTAPGDPGSRLFRAHCASCHGVTARGNGPLAENLRRPVPDLTKYTARNGGVFPRERVYRIVDGRDVPSHGDREMPVWGDVFIATRGSEPPAAVKERIDAIVRYLEGIQQRGA
jgi:mono/diheme cytochrome c family protein